MSDIFREVDEELRQEKLSALWKKYGWYVVIVAVGMVAGVAGVRGYQAWDASESATSGTEFSRAIEALNEQEGGDATSRLEALARDGHASYPVLARMRQAAALAESGARAEAVEIYDQVVADSSVDGMLRDVARVRAAFALVDTAATDEIQARIGGLADDDGPWRHTARELIALSHYRTGDFAAADAEYDKIMTDPATPAGVRGRAEMMRTLIAPNLAPTVTQ